MKNGSLSSQFLSAISLLCFTYSSIRAVFLPFMQQQGSNQSISTTAVPKKESIVLIDSRQKTIEFMTFEELEANKNYWKRENVLERVVLYLRKMLARCDDISIRADLLLELGDTLFELSKFSDAQMQYQEFCALFQGHEKIAYAHHQLILCCNEQLLTFDRDQTVTKQLIALCDEFCLEYEQSNLVAYVQKLKAHARQLLAQHELYIMQQYVTQTKYASAARRFRYFHEQFTDADQLLLEQVEEVGISLKEITGYEPNELIVQQETLVLSSTSNA